MPLSAPVLRAALSSVKAVGRQKWSFDVLAEGGNAALMQAPRALTGAGAASFLATCAQESDYFRTLTEYGSGQRYAPYIGRGFVQCTWARNYRLFGAWAKSRGLVTNAGVFEQTPTALADYRWAWLTAVWYFEVNNLWVHANKGDHLAVSQGVNGGPGRIGTSFTPNHWPERRAMFQAFRKAGDSLLPDTPGDRRALRRRVSLANQ